MEEDEDPIAGGITDFLLITKNVSGYVCNHGSPNGERDTASPRGRYGERLSVTRV